MNGVTTNFVWNGSNLAYEKANGKENYYYYDITGITSAKTDEVVKNYLKNSHGDVTAIADSSGTITKDYVYDAFGNEKTENTADTNPFKYCGEYFDAETGQIYLRNRYYDPSNGRFITEDPVRDGYNWYVYCENNPANRIDPSGKRSKEVADQIIMDNAQNIKDAATEFGVNPAILAATIYAEQRLNVNWVDDWTDYPLFVFDTSIGVSQVKISTAKMLEDNGYLEKTEAIVANGQEQVTRGEMIAIKLTDDKENIRYAAAYLKYYQDRWKEVYPEIDGRTAILASLYNQGELKPPHKNPKPSKFGEFAKENYYYMCELLGLN